MTPEIQKVTKTLAKRPSPSDKPGAVYLDRFPNANSKRSKRSSLKAIIGVLPEVANIPPEDFPWGQVTYEIAQSIRNALLANYSPESAGLHLVALRGVLRTAARLGHMPRDVYETIAEKGGPLSRPRQSSIPAGRMLSRDEILGLLDDAARVGTYADHRDVAIIALAVYTGLRRAEIASLDLVSLSIDDGASKIRVVGKGGREREVMIPDGAVDRISTYVDKCGIESGPLFPRARRGGHLVTGSRITPNGVADVINRAVKTLGEKTTTHDFRRTFASVLIEEGVDLFTVADIMGHKSIETTRKYDRRGDERKKRAAEILNEAMTRRNKR